MDSEHFRRVEEIFERALELTAVERGSFLEETCGGDELLRQEIESLLAADRSAGSFLEEPAVQTGLGEIRRQQEGAHARERIGSYQILRKIGAGGMSEVYLAVRADDEYQKRVALKIIRQDHDRDDLLRRFRTERQILAGLDHPHIAKLLDGGTTEDGLPYFVMDYIDGVPIDEYCDRGRLTVSERLALFRQICSAVQYAHQNLIVHRDIKASNILVTAEGVPKLLDFGIAKLLTPDLMAQQMEHTATWLRPMTPRYASPEQIQGKLVTTASDVYSLGVLLYKLLTGHLPYHLEPGRPPTELTRLVLEAEPERPSTVIARVETDATCDAHTRTPLTPEAVGQARRIQAPQLHRRLTGDLDNIVLMALRKEPQRRYASVERLAEDLRRSEEGLPVVARKDTLGYRASKFLRRNRLAVGAAALLVLLLAGFAVAMAVQASRIARERDQARLERDRAERVVAFMEDIFEVSDPVAGAGEDITAREILERGSERIEAELADEPLVQATLLGAIGNVFKNLGLFKRARPLLERSLEIRRELLGEGSAPVAESLNDLGVLLGLMGEMDEAERLLRDALVLRRELQDDEDPSVVQTLNHLGIVLRHQGQFTAAEKAYREALRIQETIPGQGEELATGKNNLATLLAQTGRFEDAVPLMRESLELRREVLGPRHPHLAQSLSNLGACLGMQGKLDEAEPFLREALEMYRELLDPEHPALVEALNNLGRLHQRRGDPSAAEPLIREGLEIERKRVGAEHPNLTILTRNLASLRQEQGDYAGAEAYAREALAMQRRLFGEEHGEIAQSSVRLGSILLDSGRAAEAETALREGLRISLASYPEEHWLNAAARSLLGACLASLGKDEEAEGLLVRGYETLLAGRGANHHLTRESLARLVEYYEARGDAESVARYRGGTSS